ncbi:MAG: hypothetical protein K9N06_04945 [Candidatus Cloacimonetes bacterium]|nr:hypothetical protein [Candidatus Cloacimonadota bacterium]
MRSANEMSRQILQLAQQGHPRRSFLEKISGIILDFLACDALDIRLADTVLPYIWQYDKAGIQVFNDSSFIQDADNSLIPCQSLVNTEENLCADLFQQRYNPELKFYYQKRSILVEDAFTESHYHNDEGMSLGILTGYASLLYISFVTSRNINGLLILKKKEKHFFTRDDEIFCENLATALGIAIAFQRSQYALRERVKELTCLHSMNKLLQENDLELLEIAQRLVNMVPDSFQYPEHTCCRLFLEDMKFASASFKTSASKMKHGIYNERDKIGEIEVFLNNAHDPEFLPEEYDLLESIASTTGAIYRKLKHEEEKSVMREQLRHADRLATIGQLAAGIAHELNEPLANILGYGELMQQELDKSSLAAADLEKIINSSLHARDVVRKLLLFARQMPTNLNAVNLNELVLESLQFLDNRILKNKIELQLQLVEDIAEITADASQIKQLIINLVVNAQQAMPSGGRIRITTLESAGEIILKVKDNGIGMSKKILKKIFLPFFTTKQAGEGTGLGLSVVYGIVNAHAGSIKVDSELEKGSEFTVAFPVRLKN